MTGEEVSQNLSASLVLLAAVHGRDANQEDQLTQLLHGEA